MQNSVLGMTPHGHSTLQDPLAPKLHSNQMLMLHQLPESSCAKTLALMEARGTENWKRFQLEKGLPMDGAFHDPARGTYSAVHGTSLKLRRTKDIRRN